MPHEPGQIRYGTPAGRWLLTSAVLGSAVVMLDATVVNVALPQLGRDLGAGVSGLQWTLNAYLLTLSALLLLGGSLGDRFGRRRVFLAGTAVFAVASMGCAAAPTLPILVAGRAVQGIGGALVTPASLALLQASFHPDDRGRAIGAWSALGGIAAAIGPALGGWLVQAWSWRLVFLVNLPVAVAVSVAARHVPESVDPTASGSLDVWGAVLASAGLSGLTYALIEAEQGGFGRPAVAAAGAAGIAGLVGFVVREARARHPMLPLGIFASRRFTGANLVTFAVYAALGAAFFLLIVHLQQVLGYSPVEAGLAALPVTVLMLTLSARSGALAQRIGPRLPLTAGPLIVGAAMLSMTRIEAGAGYWTAVFPSVTVFGLGLALTVAPLTATVLDAADVRHAGVASGVNNAIARVAGLIAVAGIPLAAGITGADYLDPDAFTSGFRRAVSICAGLAAAGGVLGFATMGGATCGRRTDAARRQCGVDAPAMWPGDEPAEAA